MVLEGMNKLVFFFIIVVICFCSLFIVGLILRILLFIFVLVIVVCIVVVGFVIVFDWKFIMWWVLFEILFLRDFIYIRFIYVFLGYLWKLWDICVW